MLSTSIHHSHESSGYHNNRLEEKQKKEKHFQIWLKFVGANNAVKRIGYRSLSFIHHNKIIADIKAIRRLCIKRLVHSVANKVSSGLNAHVQRKKTS